MNDTKKNIRDMNGEELFAECLEVADTVGQNYPSRDEEAAILVMAAHLAAVRAWGPDVAREKLFTGVLSYPWDLCARYLQEAEAAEDAPTLREAEVST